MEKKIRSYSSDYLIGDHLQLCTLAICQNLHNSQVCKVELIYWPLFKMHYGICAKGLLPFAKMYKLKFKPKS